MHILRLTGPAPTPPLKGVWLALTQQPMDMLPLWFASHLCGASVYRIGRDFLSVGLRFGLLWNVNSRVVLLVGTGREMSKIAFANPLIDRRLLWVRGQRNKYSVGTTQSLMRLGTPNSHYSDCSNSALVLVSSEQEVIRKDYGFEP